MSRDLLTAPTGLTRAQVDGLGVKAAQGLDLAMMALNTSLGENALFSGQKTATPALASSDQLLSALSTAISAAQAISASQVEDAVTTWFNAQTGFSAVIYQGGSPLAPVSVSADQTVQLDITAADPAIVDTLKGLALGALLSRGILSGSDVARADLAQRAGQHLMDAQVPMTSLSARLGTVQASLKDATTRNEAEDATLQNARLSLLSVDPYETATKMQEMQTQLQTLYAITARAARLSLVDFL
ncbi:MAG: flagellin [Pseudomonadota bacterium]